MRSLEADLVTARDLDLDELADAIQSIGFECTRCGACCKGYQAPEGEGREDHVATIFPDEIRDLQAETEYDWRDVARPVPFGLDERDGEPSGETFEWALQTDACGDCRFYAASANGTGACTVHADRPLICRTYPFSVVLDGTTQPMGEAVDREGAVLAHECEGLGRDIERAEAEELATALKERAVRELEEAIRVRDNYRPVETASGEVVVHDSEGPKRPDGRRVRR